MSAALEISNLHVNFGGEVDALRGVTLRLERGESLALVGESGAGKSTLANAVMGTVQPPDAKGSVRVDGQEMLGATPEELRAIRWSTVAIVPQSGVLNPVVRVADQIAEPLRAHTDLSPAAVQVRVEEVAEEALFDLRLLDRFPHQLSGGQRRHALLALAIALDPVLMVLDEPTAGMDPVGRAALLEQIVKLARSRGFALLVVSHDLPAAVHLAESSVVLYAGAAVEIGQAAALIERPAHPYSRALLNAYPVMTTTKDLHPIRGMPPDPRQLPAGCAFHPRCTQAEDVCRELRPYPEPSRGRLVACHMGGVVTLLSASNVRKSYRNSGEQDCALAGVSLSVDAGEAVGIVGQSGSGKTTLALILAGHLVPDSGLVELQGQTLAVGWSRRARELRRRVQLVMQDPWDAVSPRLTVHQLVREPLDIAQEGDEQHRNGVVAEALAAVGLPISGGFLASLAHELSGGQLQRIVLARALVAKPAVLVADEPTSMLDASEQARLLVVLREQQVERGLGLVFVSHDIAVVRKVTDRIVVLDRGRVVEEGPSEHVSGAPRSTAARRLVDAAPSLTAGSRG